MKLTLFENSGITDLFPIALNKHVAEIRWGKLTIQERWALHFEKVELHSERGYLKLQSALEGLCLLGNVLPNAELVSALNQLSPGQSMYYQGMMIAYSGFPSEASGKLEYNQPLNVLNKLTDLFTQLKHPMELDAEAAHGSDFCHVIPEGVLVVGDVTRFKCATTAKIQPGAIINCSEGPVIIDDEAEVMEGCMIRGPFYLGKKSTLKMGTKVYGPTSIGPECKVGGEVSNVLFLGYSNKAHDGFLGNAVVGEWCNFGADSNCSNLKNNYGVVKQYSYTSGNEESTGLTFCGVVMGDHSKCGINTMFNTGTVVGIAANVFGAGFPNKHIPSFSWGGAENVEPYEFEKAIETIKAVKARRGLELSAKEWQVLSELHKQFGLKK